MDRIFSSLLRRAVMQFTQDAPCSGEPGANMRVSGQDASTVGEPWLQEYPAASNREAHCPAVPRRSVLALGAGALAVGLLPACAHSQAVPPGPGMTASVTYLNLLAKTPMFRDMSREQLQWVIDHSREWAVAPGALVASSERGADRFWTLLDGGWQVEQGSKAYPAGHADPAKWYGGRDMLALGLAPTRLVATKRSYVMEIEQAALDEMLRRGIPLAPHLRAGLDFYRKLAR